MGDDVGRRWSVAANAVGGTLGALAGAVSAPALGPGALVLGALSGAIAEDYVMRYAEDRARRVRALVTTAAEDARLSVDDLVLATLDDERKRELLARAVQEAARTIDEQQIMGLARAFATGALASDRAVVDDAMLALEIIGQLAGPHWRVIALLLGPSRMSGLDPTHPEIGSKYARAWLLHEIIEDDPGLTPAIDALIGKLNSLGVIVDLAVGSIEYRARWALTEFGKTCADYMRVLGHNQVATSRST